MFHFQKSDCTGRRYLVCDKTNVTTMWQGKTSAQETPEAELRIGADFPTPVNQPSLHENQHCNKHGCIFFLKSDQMIEVIAVIFQHQQNNIFPRTMKASRNSEDRKAFFMMCHLVLQNHLESN